MFSIESPGAAFVMFIIGETRTNPEDHVQEQIAALRKIMDTPMISRFQRFGQFSGTGATLRGKIFGIRTTSKVFSFYENDLTVIIIQQYPDEDLKYVQEGLTLIESSFSVRASGETNE